MSDASDSRDRPNILITYRFEYRNGDVDTYDVELDGTTLALVAKQNGPEPDWAGLDFYRCDGCPLDAEVTHHCPVAVNLNRAATLFRADASIKPVKVSVITKERTYVKETALQNGLYSLFGLIMSTSGCPSLDFLKPMARFHLPFASIDETVMRTTSMYLLGQFYAARQGKPFDQEFGGLDDHYRKVRHINQAISKRLSRITRGDADHNAINVLHSFACMTGLVLENNLDYLAYLWDNEDPPQDADT